MVTVSRGPATLRLSDPRVRRVSLVSVVAWLALGWLWGDELWWTIVRAFAATITILGIVASLRWVGLVPGLGRVVLGAVSGGWCAASLGGDGRVVVIVATVFAVALTVSEHTLVRDLRRSAAD